MIAKTFALKMAQATAKIWLVCSTFALTEQVRGSRTTLGPTLKKSSQPEMYKTTGWVQEHSERRDFHLHAPPPSILTFALAWNGTLGVFLAEDKFAGLIEVL